MKVERHNMNQLLEKYRNLPVTVKASAWYMICNILQNALGFITLPIFTRILTTEEYGLFSVYLTWMNMMVIFTTLNLAYGVFNTAMIKYEYERDQFTAAMQGLTTVISIIWLIVYGAAHDLWNKLFELPTLLMVVMAIEMMFLPAKDFWCGRQRFEYKYKGMVIYTIALTILNPLICIFAILGANEDTDKGIIRIVVAAAVNVAFYLVIYIRNFVKGKVFYNKEYWRYGLSMGIPLIMYYISQMIFNQSDKLMIQHLVGLDKAGIYSLIYSCSIIIVFVINAINNTYIPWKYENIKDRNFGDVGRVSTLLAGGIAVILYLVVLGGPEIVKIVATPEYYEAIWIMPPVIASLFFLFMSQLFINVEFYYEEKQALVKGSIFSAIVNIVLNYFCILKWGYIAAGYTTLLAYIIFALANYYYMTKIVKEKLGDIEIFQIKNLLIMGTLFLVICMLTLLIYEQPIIRWIILFAIVLITLLNCKKIIAFIQQIMAKK